MQMEWKGAEKKDQGLTKIPKRWLHIHYYEALNILFRFENSLRVFVYAVLKNEFRDKWDESSFSFSGGESQSIKGIAQRRINQAENFGYLGYDIRAPLMHLTSGELIELLTSNAYWEKFRPHFKGNKEIIKNKLLEIGNIRNSLAHFRPIKADDIELIKQNSRHTLLGVEKCLQSIFSQPLRVPTNTAEDWYKSISVLGIPSVSTTPYFSADEEWINVKLTFTAPMLGKQRYSESYYQYVMGTLNSPNVLSQYTALRKHVTYLSEYVNYPSQTAEYDLQITKDLNFVFRRDVLVSVHQELAQEFSGILRVIAEESELLRQDNLARGKLVESASANAVFYKPENAKEARWHFNYHSLSREYQSEHPNEYWGQPAFGGDIVGGARRYPWMPDDISESDGWLD